MKAHLKFNLFHSKVFGGAMAMIMMITLIGWSAQYVLGSRPTDLPSTLQWLQILIRGTTSHPMTLVWLTASLLLVAVIAYQSRSAFDESPLWFFGLALVVAMSIAVFVASVCILKSILGQQGIGTIQNQLDGELQQEDLAVTGELGFYGGLLENPETGTTNYYICRSIDNYGPFSFPVLVDTSTQAFTAGFEQFAYDPEGDMAYSVTMRQYDDGYWVSVKRFASTEKLRVEIASLADLEKYIVQLEFTNHSRDTRTESSLLHELEQRLTAFGVN